MTAGWKLDGAPNSDGEWARLVEKRLRGLEQPRSLRVGEWVLTAREGVLTANRPGQPPMPITGPIINPDGTPAGPRSEGLPSAMPDDWWTPLLNAILGGGSTIDPLADLAAYLDSMWASLWSGWTSVPVGNLVSGGRNMLWNPDFKEVISLLGGTEWVYDSEVYLDNLTGAGQGSARCQLDGLPHLIRSNVVDVGVGQVLDLSASFLADGLSITAGTTPIGIGVATYNAAGVRLGTIIRASRGQITGPVLGWVGAPSTSRTASIAASYTVPHAVDPNEQVAKVAMVIAVTPDALAGRLWVDKCSMQSGGLIPQNLVDGLNQAWEGLFSGFGATGQTGLDTIWNNLLSMFGLGKPALGSGGFDRNTELTRWAQDILGPLGVFLTPEFKAHWADLTHAVLIYLFGGKINGTTVAGWSSAAEDNMAEAYNGLLDVFGLPPAERPDMSNLWAVLANPLLKFFGLPTIDLPSQLDSTIPKAPTLLWPLAQFSTGTTVPQNTNLYYVATVTVNNVESAKSNEVMLFISPAWLVSKAKVLVSWVGPLPAGGTLNIYRRTSQTGQYRRVATGRTGTSYTDSDPGTAATAQPGAAEAMAAGIIEGQFTSVDTKHQALTDAVTTGATGNESAQNTPADTAEAVSALRTSVADIRAALDDLQNEAQTPTGGVRFAASNNGWDNGTGLWTVTGTGTPAFTPSRAYTMVRQTGNRYIYATYGTVLSSDQQTVSLTFNASPGNPNGFSDSSQYGGSNLAILRSNAAMTQFVFARIWQNRIRFGYYQSGTLTMVGSTQALPGNIGPGVSVVVRCPNQASPYYFEARIAGNLIASWTFTAAQAPYGANYRRIGQGMMIGTGILGDLFMPGLVQQVSAADMNVGPGFIKGGIGGVMRRYSDAAFNQQASFVSTVPENYFEVLEAVSPGVTKLTGGGAAGFIVEKAGLYLAEAGFFVPGGANYYGATFYTGAFGQSGTIHSYNTYFTQFARGMAVIVANDGDVIKPAATNGTTAVANMTGTSDGRNAFFSIARIG